MNIGNVDRRALLAAYSYVNQMRKSSTTGKISFADMIKQTAENTSVSRKDQYVEYLKQRYGVNVMVKNIGKDQRSIDNFGASIVGYNNVVIAPNILEKMVNDPEKAADYENKIKAALDKFPKCQAELSAMGHEIHSYAVGVDADGIVHIYVTGDLKPEVRARIEAQIKAEQEEKRTRRERYKTLSEEAAARHREQMKLQTYNWLVTEALQTSAGDSIGMPNVLFGSMYPQGL